MLGIILRVYHKSMYSSSSILPNGGDTRSRPNFSGVSQQPMKRAFYGPSLTRYSPNSSGLSQKPMRRAVYVSLVTILDKEVKVGFRVCCSGFGW
jgi:hypothetical protein